MSPGSSIRPRLTVRRPPQLANLPKFPPRKRDITPDAANCLRTALQHYSTERDFSVPGVEQCYEAGWLHSEAVDIDGDRAVLVFPSPLHCKVVENLPSIREPRPFDNERFPTIEVLCEQTIRSLSTTSLRASWEGRIDTSGIVRGMRARESWGQPTRLSWMSSP